MNQEDDENDFKLDESRFKSRLIVVDGSWQFTSETRWKATDSPARRLTKSAESAWTRRRWSVPRRGGSTLTSGAGGPLVS